MTVLPTGTHLSRLQTFPWHHWSPRVLTIWLMWSEVETDPSVQITWRARAFLGSFIHNELQGELRKPVGCPSICEPMKSPSATSLLFASYFKLCTQHQEKPERHKDEFISPLEKLSVWTSGDAIEGNHNCETQSTRVFDRRIKVFIMVTGHPCPWGGVCLPLCYFMEFLVHEVFVLSTSYAFSIFLCL